MFKRQYSRITDYNNSFLEDQLDRPQISLIALIIDFDLNDIVEIWEIIGLSMVYKHYMDAGLEILQWKSIMISTTFQQHATEIIVPDLHITEQIQCVNTYSATNQQLYNKKVRYAKRFGKMKKALNLELDFGFDKEKMSIENINDESSSDQLELMIINDPLVTKHCGRPLTKRLKSSSETKVMTN
ncbi:hypothetical protein C2G38_2250743 [Gigaspora rosea]|uniref:Uncharacterized protein n=1 Tax=Gigaspora rosea TaxID=44941 RepID=A0A397UJL9_9GLOM|nr:hypothetical protein C2G38_2250743 [Gigaspora rosea]